MVGAGPTGLLLAAELERRGVACLLIDALEAPQTWDRATVVHERTLEIFEALGIAEPLIADGVKTRGARFYSDGELVGELLLDATESRYGYQLGVSEEVTEAVLTDHLEAQGGAVTRSTRLVGTATADDGVVATSSAAASGRRSAHGGWSAATATTRPSARRPGSTTPGPRSRPHGRSSMPRPRAGTARTTSSTPTSTSRR